MEFVDSEHADCLNGCKLVQKHWASDNNIKRSHKTTTTLMFFITVPEHPTPPHPTPPWRFHLMLWRPN